MRSIRYEQPDITPEELCVDHAAEMGSDDWSWHEIDDFSRYPRGTCIWCRSECLQRGLSGIWLVDVHIIQEWP